MILLSPPDFAPPRLPPYPSHVARFFSNNCPNCHCLGCKRIHISLSAPAFTLRAIIYSFGVGAVRDNPEAKKALEQHPFYDQGPRQDTRITDAMIRNIDALIQRLRDER